MLPYKIQDVSKVRKTYGGYCSSSQPVVSKKLGLRGAYPPPSFSVTRKSHTQIEKIPESPPHPYTGKCKPVCQMALDHVLWHGTDKGNFLTPT